MAPPRLSLPRNTFGAHPAGRHSPLVEMKGRLMKLSLVAATTAATLVSAALGFAQEPKAAPPIATLPSPAAPEFKDLKSKVSYGFGLDMGKKFKLQGVDIDPQIMARGLKDGLGSGKALMTDDEIQAAIKTFSQELMSKQAEMAQKKAASAKQDSEAFLKANGAKAGVVTRPSGLQYKIVKEGTGPSPKATDSVTVHYEGRLVDGTVFDSSIKRGTPETFGVTQVIKGWTEALQLMKKGSKWEVYIPAELAYGANPRPGGAIPPNAALVFDVELLGIGGDK
jgi:FKBP-type peptidyl-prolyl cis-trans isomerase FklB